MREATGNALLITMVSTIIGVIMVFFVGSISYSKSYRIKNYIINTIEENESWNLELEKTIDEYLKEAGYNVRSSNKGCSRDDKCGNAINNQNGYNYCVYECNENNKKYYKVITYMKFDFPIIGNAVQFPVKGETIIFGDYN